MALPKPAEGSALLLDSSRRRSQSPDVQRIPPATGDHPFLLPTVPIQLQSPPETDPESPAEEQSILLIQPSVDFVTAAMSKLGSLNIYGQSMGSQGSMLPSDSRKLAHLALRAKDVPVRVPDTYRPRGSSGMLCFVQQSSFSRHCALPDLQPSLQTFVRPCMSGQAAGTQVNLHAVGLRASMCVCAESSCKRNSWRHPADAASLGPLP